MSKARRLKKTAKREHFYGELQEALLEAVSWAKGDIVLRTTVVTSAPQASPAGGRRDKPGALSTAAAERALGIT